MIDLFLKIIHKVKKVFSQSISLNERNEVLNELKVIGNKTKKIENEIYFESDISFESDDYIPANTETSRCDDRGVKNTTVNRSKYSQCHIYSFTELEFIQSKFVEKLEGFEVEVFELTADETIYLLNDSLPILFYKTRLTNDWKEYFAIPFESPCENQNIEYFQVKIVELLPNDIQFYYNHAQFVREIKEHSIFSDLWENDVFRYTFKGFQYIENEIYEGSRTIDEIDELIPELELRRRYDEWNGYKDKFACLEFEMPNQKIYQLLIHCYKEPTEVVRLFTNSLIKQGKFIEKTGIGYRVKQPLSLDNKNTIGELNITPVGDELNQILSNYVEKDMEKILGKYLKYFFTEFNYKEDGFKGERWTSFSELSTSDWKVKFSNVERHQFKKSTPKWTSEYSLFNLVKKEFRDYKVIYQHTPRFLKSSIGGQMSYDIYISKKKIAIEYQGKQHFEPVEFFGGQKGFEQTIRRDKEKLRISKENGVEVVYYNYWEKISKDILLEKLSHLI